MVKESNKKSRINPDSLLLTTFRKIKPTNRSFKSLKLYVNKNKPHQRTVLIKEDTVEHIGRNFEKDGAEKLVKYVVGIRNPETDEVEFVELKDIYDVEMRVPEVEEKHEISQPFYNPEHKRRLVQEFGTNKSKRKVNQMMSNTIRETK